MAPSAIPLWGPVRWCLSIPEPPNVRSRVLFRSDRGHYRRREAPDPQRLQRGRGFVHVKARQAFPAIGRQVRRREQTAGRASTLTLSSPAKASLFWVNLVALLATAKHGIAQL